MDIGKRLVQLRKLNNVTQEELGKQIGVGKTTISNYETGYSTPDTETVSRIADFFGVSVDYLLGRTDIKEVNPVEEPKLREEFIGIMKEQGGSLPLSTIEKVWDKIIPTNKNKKKILPILGSIRAGLPILANEHVEDILEVPDYIEADYALRVQGDSMAGAGILDGDLAICKEAQTAHSGQVVVALHDLATGFSEATLKYYFNGSGSNPILRAANPNYQDIDMKEGYRIAGVMVALIREDTPSYQVYQNYLAVNDSEEWNEVIEEASAAGIKPIRMKSFIKMLKEMK